MRLNRTPIDVLFEILDTEFDVDKRSVSRIVLANREVEWGQGKKNGRAMAENLSNRRLLTDNVSNALPGSIPRDALDDLQVSIPSLLSSIVEGISEGQGRPSSRERYDRVCEILLREYPDVMMAALEDYACCSDIFDNVLDSIRDLPFSSSMDRARTALALYVTTGYLGDPYWAANLTIQYCSRACGVALLEEHGPEEALGRERAIGALGLQRVFNGGVRGRRHTLDPDGTVIGMLPEPDASFIADVNNSVSAEHLRIWRGEDGAWLAEGLGSLYGTKLERPGIDEPIVIEPPLGEDGPVDSVPILPGDVLMLGSTRFEVQLFDRGE